MRYEYFEEIPNGSTRVKIRYNPEEREIYQGSDWGWSTRAYHSAEEGTYLDFQATPNLESAKPLEEQSGTLRGYEQAYAIIYFAYTCEHEFQHDIQDQLLEDGALTPRALRVAKDRVVIGHLLSHLEGGREFYWDAHDDFYIEDDANAAASKFMRKVIPENSPLSKRIANPQDPPQYQYSVQSILDRREREGQTKRDEYTFSVGENDIDLPQKEYRGSAEEIVSDLLDDAMAAHPGFIMTYPVLGFEYNFDGTRRFPKKKD